MEKQFTITIDGQEIRDADWNLLGLSGLVDDKVFAEMFRFPGAGGDASIAKWIIPHLGWTVTAGIPIQNWTDIVAISGTNNGSVAVLPFRAVMGSRIGYLTDAKQNAQEVRTTIHNIPAGQLSRSVGPFASNATGNPRIDLVYAAVTPDVASSTVSRKVKNPSTKVVTTQLVSVSKETTVTISIAAGTAAASPVPPAMPSDAAGTYYIPLAYVRIPDGFSGTSTVAYSDIINIAPIPNLSPTTGANVTRPASSISKVGSLGYNSSLPTAQLTAWAQSGAVPSWMWPAAVVGQTTLYLGVDNTNASSGNRSHNTGAIVDDSANWNNRIFDWTVWYATTGTPYAFAQGATGYVMPSCNQNGPTLSTDTAVPSCSVVGVGQSFVTEATYSHGLTLEAGARPIMILNASNSLVFTGFDEFVLYVAPSGALKAGSSGQLPAKLFIKINASSAFTPFAR